MFRSLKKFFQKTKAFFRDIDSSKTLIKMASYGGNMVDKETSIIIIITIIITSKIIIISLMKVKWFLRYFKN